MATIFPKKGFRTSPTVTTRIRRTEAEARAYQRERDIKNAVEAARNAWDQERMVLAARIRELEAAAVDMQRRLIEIVPIARLIGKIASGE